MTWRDRIRLAFGGAILSVCFYGGILVPLLGLSDSEINQTIAAIIGFALTIIWLSYEVIHP